MARQELEEGRQKISFVTKSTPVLGSGREQKPESSSLVTVSREPEVQR